MSYLTLAAGVPDFSKAVFSLWFRVPKASVVAAANHMLETQRPGFSMMQSILPLVTFGVPQTSKPYETPVHDVMTGWHAAPGHETPPPVELRNRTYYVEGQPYDVDPSYIGLQCHTDGTFDVTFNLQTAGFMKFSASTYVTTGLEFWSGSDPSGPILQANIPGTGVIAPFPYVAQAAISDASYVDNYQPEFFNVVSDNAFSPDRWHHVLMSFDIGGGVSIGTPFATSSSRLWYAIDDVDYRGAANLQPYRDTAGPWGPDNLNANAILTQNAWRFSGSDPNSDAVYYENYRVGLPSGTFTGGSIPSGAPMGLPASAKYVDSIFRCEMAEFQMWTGVTLDTGNVSNRRAFVSAAGKPVNPTKGAQKLLGKPLILLTGNSRWQKGRNTGTLGSTTSSAGHFKPTAKINKYKPEPAL